MAAAAQISFKASERAATLGAAIGSCDVEMTDAEGEDGRSGARTKAPATASKIEDKAEGVKKRKGKHSALAVKEEPREEEAATSLKDTDAEGGGAENLNESVKEEANGKEKQEANGTATGVVEEESVAGQESSGGGTVTATETKSNGDVAVAPAFVYDPAAEVILADGGLESRTGPPPWATEGPAWRLIYGLSSGMQKAALAKATEVDNKRALLQDLR